LPHEYSCVYRCAQQRCFDASSCVEKRNPLYQIRLFLLFQRTIRVITKLPNSEQSYKGKVKTHKYINRQNQSTTGKL
jgi:hypothetical protein